VPPETPRAIYRQNRRGDRAPRFGILLGDELPEERERLNENRSSFSRVGGADRVDDREAPRRRVRTPGSPHKTTDWRLWTGQAGQGPEDQRVETQQGVVHPAGQGRSGEERTAAEGDHERPSPALEAAQHGWRSPEAKRKASG